MPIGVGQSGLFIPQDSRIDVSQFNGVDFPQPTRFIHFNLHGYYKVTDRHGNTTREFHQQGFDTECRVANVQNEDGTTVSADTVTAIF